MITEQHQEEALSAAYIAACAAKAGCNMTFTQHDYGVDGTLHPVQIFGRRRLQLGFPIDFQAKASVDWEVTDGRVVYDLEVKTFNDFVRRKTDGGTPLVLILLCLPRERENWLEMGEDFIKLRNCCYWYHSDEAELTDNDETRRIKIPTSQRFTPEAVVQLLTQSRNGDLR